MRSIKITKTITKRETPALQAYLQEISAIPLITPEKEVELAKRISKGDKQAFTELVEANLRFVVSVAKKYQNNGIPCSDLINIGNRGLIKAVLRFDHTLGLKGITYFIWWIRHAILHAIAEYARIIRMPLNQVALLNSALKAEAALQQAKGRKVTPEEIAEKLDKDPEQIRRIMRMSARHKSLDSPLLDGESNTLLDVLPSDEEAPPDDNLVLEGRRQEINDILEGVLTPRDASIIRMAYGLDGKPARTYEEIGALLSPAITRERVRQLVDKIFKTLRGEPVKKRLRAFL